MNQAFTTNKNSFTKIFLNTLSKVSNNAPLVSALLLDAIYKDYDYVNSDELISTIFKSLKSDLHPNKIEGLLDALLEYQLNFTISESVFNELTELLVSRIFDGDAKDYKWINKVFLLFTNSYSFRRLNNLFSIIFIPRVEIPENIIDDYLNVIKKFIRLEKHINNKYYLALNQLITRLDLEISNRSDISNNLKSSDLIIKKYTDLHNFLLDESTKSMTSNWTSNSIKNVTTNNKFLIKNKDSMNNTTLKKSTSKEKKLTPSKILNNKIKLDNVNNNHEKLNFSQIIDRFRFINNENYNYILQNFSIEGFITNNEKVKKLLILLDKFSKNDDTIIILGPSKSGKSTLSKVLAEKYLLNKGIAKNEIDTKIITDVLIEQNFQDIKSARKKLFGDINEGNLRLCSFHRANNGVHILDEFGRGKNKLLKILEPYIRKESNEYNSVGSSVINEIFTKYIIVSSLDLDVPEIQRKFKIASDTIGRCMSNKIKYPHLDEIKEDIPLLINFFLYKKLKDNSKKTFEIPLDTNDYITRIIKKSWKNEYHSLHQFIDELYKIFSIGEKLTTQRVFDILGSI